MKVSELRERIAVLEHSTVALAESANEIAAERDRLRRELDATIRSHQKRNAELEKAEDQVEEARALLRRIRDYYADYMQDKQPQLRGEIQRALQVTLREED